MNISHLFSMVQWLPTLVMTIVSFAIGMFWHSSVMFGKTWKKENNYPETKEGLNLPLIFGGTAVLHYIALAALSVVCVDVGWLSGLITGFVISVVWIFTALGGTYLFANRSLKLLFIDAGMYMFLFAISGLVFGVW